MESMILQEVEKGKFRKDVSTKKMAFMLLTTSSQLIDFLKLKMGTALDDNVMNGRPIFANCEKDLMDTLEQFISLMSSAMNEKTK
jgi:predicted metalloenzyme YecM